MVNKLPLAHVGCAGPNKQQQQQRRALQCSRSPIILCAADA